MRAHTAIVCILWQETAAQLADTVDPIASQIGAVNTLVRQPNGRLAAYNTDWTAAISAIEQGLRRTRPSDALPSTSYEPAPKDSSPLKGLVVVVLGAGGSAKALVYGAIAAGAQVIIANRLAIAHAER